MKPASFTALVAAFGVACLAAACGGSTTDPGTNSFGGGNDAGSFSSPDATRNSSSGTGSSSGYNSSSSSGGSGSSSGGASSSGVNSSSGSGSGGGACTITCNTDSDCGNCGAGVWCCDTSTTACYNPGTSSCPTSGGADAATE